MAFRVQGVSQMGEERILTLNALSMDEAATIAREHGLFPYAVTEIPDAPVPKRIAVPPPVATPNAESTRGPLSVWGVLLIAIGICVAGYFFFVYDTTVSTPSSYVPGYGSIGGGRVHNIGLQQDRLLGCLAGMIAAAVGAVMVAVDSKSKKSGGRDGSQAG